MAVRQSTVEGVVMNPSRSFWAGKRVLLTGHTGFKGSWLSLWLHSLNAKVTGISLPPPTSHPNLFSLAGVNELTDSHYLDIRDAEPLAQLVCSTTPDIVFHLAAQPLVRSGYRQPLETFTTNVMGTTNLLESLRRTNSVKVVVVITTDKVYVNKEWPYPYREEDILGGHDPYSASKAAAEIITASFRSSFLAAQGMAVATARAGNVIGGGDWSADRLIPDAVRAWESCRPLDIRSPHAVRPWQHVVEPLAGYLRLAEHLWSKPHLAGAYNFGPDTHAAATVRQVIEHAQKFFKNSQVIWGDGSDGPHEAGLLALETAKARATLGILPRFTLFTAIERTMSWYALLVKGAAARDLCIADLREYEAMA